MFEWLGGAIGGAASIFNNERNLSYQREAQEYQKQLNERMMQREDTAVQRRVTDLKAAGLSPVLAAGSAASAQAGAPIKPLESQDSLGVEGFSRGMQPFLVKQQISQSVANTTAAKANASLASARAAIAWKDAKLWLDSNLDVRDRDPYTKLFKALSPYLKDISGSLKSFGEFGRGSSVSGDIFSEAVNGNLRNALELANPMSPRGSSARRYYKDVESNRDRKNMTELGIPTFDAGRAFNDVKNSRRR